VEVASLVGNIALEGRVRPTLESMIVESPPHLRRAFDAASGLARLDLR
jgi:predicted DNA-binding protein with PD1-like motif